MSRYQILSNQLYHQKEDVDAYSECFEEVKFAKEIFHQVNRALSSIENSYHWHQTCEK